MLTMFWVSNAIFADVGTAAERPPSGTPYITEYGVSVNYAPDGAEGYLQDPSGTTRWVKVVQGVESRFFSTVTLAPMIESSLWMSSVGIKQVLTLQKNGVFTPTITTNHTWKAGGQLTFAHEQSEVNTKVTINGDYPWVFGGGLAIGITSDPVVLKGGISYNIDLVDHNQTVTFSGSRGFVVNEQVNMSLILRHTVAIATTDLPQTTLVFDTTNTTGGNGNTEIGIQTSLTLRGSQTNVGIGVRLRQLNSTVTNSK